MPDVTVLNINYPWFHGWARTTKLLSFSHHKRGNGLAARGQQEVTRSMKST